MRFTPVLLFFFLFSSCVVPNRSQGPVSTEWALTIPAGGNSWVIDHPEKDGALISDEGIRNWSDPADRIRTYFRLEETGELQLAIRARTATGSARIRCRFGERVQEVTVAGPEWTTLPVGTFTVDRPGYHWLELEGLDKTGDFFAEVAAIQLGGKVARGKVYYVKDEFYWSRRGPSVHWRFDPPAGVDKVEWFYSELTIPIGQDVMGSYFMANGFGEGYFGIQVNSPSERRVLFSIWSPYETDNPGEIPESHRIRLLRKGEGVHTGEFGNEGSGGQSYLVYNWQAGNTYRFLTRAAPAGDNATDYTAYFYAPEAGQWKLIAAFRRPQTNTYLTDLYSFLENFLPETGNTTRMGLFANQWICDTSGRWHELTDAMLTADNTARKKNRLDFTGGVENGQFFLKNCGFFNETGELEKVFSRPPTGKAPDVDFRKLP